jgi:predicted tellurium resistance membrane protein TerC
MAWMNSPEAWIALAALTLLEIVLGIDNIIFISILVTRLPAHQRQRARVIGLALAMIMRIVLLLSLTWVMQLTQPLFTVLTEAISGRDLILIVGGFFLLAKSTLEIHASLEGDSQPSEAAARSAFMGVLLQIVLLDAVFSLDSVITAIGIAKHVPVMIIAIVIAIGVMMLSANSIGIFIDAHPTVKILALSFLLLIGVTLVAEGLEFHIPKGYVYFAMAFSVGVEMLNMRMRKRTRAPLELRKSIR